METSTSWSIYDSLIAADMADKGEVHFIFKFNGYFREFKHMLAWFKFYHKIFSTFLFIALKTITLIIAPLLAKNGSLQ